MRSLGIAPDGTEQFVTTDAEGNVVLQTKYADAKVVTDRNAQLRSAGHGNGKEWKLAASIPLSLVHKWRVEHGVDVFSPDPDMRRKARQLLNSSDYSQTRIWEGNL